MHTEREWKAGWSKKPRQKCCQYWGAHFQSLSQVGHLIAQIQRDTSISLRQVYKTWLHAKWNARLPASTKDQEFFEFGPEALCSDKQHAPRIPCFISLFIHWWHRCQSWLRPETPEQTISNMTLDSRSKSLLEEVRVILTGIKAQIWTDMTYFGKKRKNTLVAPNSQSKPSHYTWIVASNIYRFSISMKENVLKSDLSSTSFIDV